MEDTCSVRLDNEVYLSCYNCLLDSQGGLGLTGNADHVAAQETGIHQSDEYSIGGSASDHDTGKDYSEA